MHVVPSMGKKQRVQRLRTHWQLSAKLVLIITHMMLRTLSVSATIVLRTMSHLSLNLQNDL